MLTFPWAGGFGSGMEWRGSGWGGGGKNGDTLLLYISKEREWYQNATNRQYEARNGG